MAGSAHAAGGGGMGDSQDDSDLGGETEVIIIKLVIILQFFVLQFCMN
jgi:hypothetical protein